MNVGVEHEAMTIPGGPGSADAVTYSWAEGEGRWCGLARMGVALGAATPSGSAMAVMFKGSEPLGIHAEGGLEPPPNPDWSRLTLGALQANIAAPLQRWSVRYDGDGHGFDLVFDAISAPAGIDERHPVGELGGMDRYEQLCEVHGRVWDAEGLHEIKGLGQRGHAWGQTDWGAIAQTRTLSAWFGEEGGGITLATLLAADAEHHDAEAHWGVLFGEDDPVEIFDPRLSTTYDGDGRQYRAGLELWMDEEGEYPVRAAGHAICGATIDLGALRVELAFMRWTSDGRHGLGRYEIVRPA